MFSLIITIVSIALVAALALATLYYGGNAFDRASADAKASQVVNQSQQLLGAADLFFANNGRWPATVDELVDQRYLKAVPVARIAVGPAQAQDVPWDMVTTGMPVFFLSTEVVEVCRSVNEKGVGDRGIASTVDPEVTTQCFSPTPTRLLTLASKDPSWTTAALGDPAASSSVSGTALRARPSSDSSADWRVSPSAPRVSGSLQGEGTGGNDGTGGTGAEGDPGGGGGQGETPQEPETAAALLLNPTSVTFAEVPAFRASTASISLTNEGNAELDIVSATPTPGSPFRVTGGSCVGTTLQPAQSCSYALEFLSEAQGDFTAQLTVISNATGSPHVADLSARALAPIPFVVSNVTPTTGVSSLSNQFQLTGQGFRSPLMVKVGGAQVTAEIANSEGTSATAFFNTIPFGNHPVLASNAGAADVQIGIYRAEATLASAVGPANGGYNVAISAAGFTADSKVFFGANPAPVASFTATAAIVTVPAGTPFTTVDVRLQSAAAQQASDLVLTGAFTYQDSDITDGNVTTLFSGRTTNNNTAPSQQRVAFAPGSERIYFSAGGSIGFAPNQAGGGGLASYITGVSDAAVAAYGNSLYYATSYANVYRCPANSSSCTQYSISGSNPVRAMAMSPSGDRIYMLSTFANLRYVNVNAATGIPTSNGTASFSVVSGALDVKVHPVTGEVYILYWNSAAPAAGYYVQRYSRDMAVIGQPLNITVGTATASAAMAVSGNGGIFVGANNRVYKYVDGSTTLLAGSGTAGLVNGSGANAQFEAITDMEIVGGKLYVYTYSTANRFAVRVVQ